MLVITIICCIMFKFVKSMGFNHQGQVCDIRQKLAILDRRTPYLDLDMDLELDLNPDIQAKWIGEFESIKCTICLS